MNTIQAITESKMASKTIICLHALIHLKHTKVHRERTEYTAIGLSMGRRKLKS